MGVCMCDSNGMHVFIWDRRQTTAYCYSTKFMKQCNSRDTNRLYFQINFDVVKAQIEK